MLDQSVDFFDFSNFGIVSKMDLVLAKYAVEKISTLVPARATDDIIEILMIEI